MTPPPEETAGCARCEGSGYLLGTDGEHASARRCACMTPCSRCGGSHLLVTRDEKGNNLAVRCACDQLDRRIQLFNDARVPARFSGSFIEDLVETHRTQKEVKYALLKHRDAYQPGDSGFLLWGEPGVGKTHLLCGLASYLTLERGISVRFIDFVRLIMDLKAAYNEGRWDSEVLTPLLSAQVLIIDELGKGRASDYEGTVLDQLISNRYNSRRTLHCSSNYPPVEPPRSPSGVSYTDAGQALLAQTLKDRVGERIFSRLHEMCRLMRVEGEDFRMGHSQRRTETGRKKKPSND
ncbi:MAG: ATP-binding protein [Deltaproteobacteria bacterium]|nr:ATP-binding protein [Deltaproteobacteria bacterium]